MMDRNDTKSKAILMSLVIGVLSSLAASLILNTWAGLPDLSRWAVSAGIGVFVLVVLAAILCRRRPERESVGATRVVSDIQAKDDVEARDITVEDDGARESLEVASNIVSKNGSVVIEGVRVGGDERKKDID